MERPQVRPALAERPQLGSESQPLNLDLCGLTRDEIQLLRYAAQPRVPLALVVAGVD